ncbi:hypothetical protein Cgig2_017440 [Carnegiea gigantea]|uniref:Cytochrome P450 n=1 Tax=Carnegiea gigantea TaxID=171969 RepID=A0A9Q1JRF1_9CARY|nr:hypothetical protein Cgig2_017440 [Carnegiea gigantea]
MSSFLLLNSFFLLAVILYLIFLYKWLSTNNQKNPPPSPPKMPILGNLHQLGKVPHRSLQSLSQKYGDLMLLQLGRKPTLVVSSANAVEGIIKTHELIFSNRPRSIIASKLLYNGKDVVFANYGEYWRQMKSICVLQLLSTKRVRSFRAIREEETALMVEKIMRSIPSVVNLTETFVTLASDVVCRAAFGRKYSREWRGNFMVLLKQFVELLGEFPVGDFVPWLHWIDKVNGLEGKMRKVAKEFDAILEQILEEHLHSPNTQGNGHKSDKGEKMKDFVDVLLDVQRDETVGFSVDRESMKALILDMFAAGTDTTSTLLEWAMSELLRHPRALKKLQEEVRRMTAGKATANEHDLEKMEYLKAVIKETLRLHPPLPLLVSRESIKDVKVSGCDIAARTQVVINAWPIQRDPFFWEEPNEFRPERFLGSTVDFKGHNFQLIPFGVGRRGCPGILFAISGAELVLANLVYAFDWELPDRAKAETLDMTESAGLSVHRRDPLLAVATPYLFA